MATKLEIMMELDRRGKLPPDKKMLLDEAVRRGLVPGAQDPSGKRFSAESPAIREKLGAITAETKQPFAESLSSEALSGVNEGLANAMSVPAMLANSVLSVGPTAVNAVAGTDFKGPNYIPDPGMPALELMKMSGAVKPQSEEPKKQVVRRIAQEVGAALPFGMTKPLATIATAMGSGAGAATAEQLAPDNPWAELVGQLAGGATTGAFVVAANRLAAAGVKPKATLSGDDLKTLKTEAYKVADTLGVKYSPQGYGKMVGQVEAAAKAGNISQTRHPKAWSLIEDFKARGANQHKGGLTLTELDQLRQEVRRDLLQSSDMSERHFGGVIMDEIDDFIAKAGAGDMLAGDGKLANEAILTARELNTRWRKTETIEDALYAADLKAAAATGDVNGAIKRAFNSILLNKKKRAGFSAEEIAEMEKIVKSGDGANLLRNVGRLSADTGFKTLLHGLLATHLGPAYAAVPVVASAAKAAARGNLAKKAENLRAKVAQGNGTKKPATVAPVSAPDLVTPLTATYIGGAANQNAITVAPVLPQNLRMEALN